MLFCSQASRSGSDHDRDRQSVSKQSRKRRESPDRRESQRESKKEKSSKVLIKYFAQYNIQLSSTLKNSFSFYWTEEEVSRTFSLLCIQGISIPSQHEFQITKIKISDLCLHCYLYTPFTMLVN